MRTVLHLRPTNFLGGPEKQLLEHALLLPCFGWRALIASFQEGTNSIELIQRATALGIESAVIRDSGPLDFLSVERLQRLLRSSGADLLVSHGFKSDVIGYLAGKATGIPVVGCVRGFTGENRKVRLYEAVDRICLRRMDRVVAVSNGTARMLASIGVPESRIRVVENAVRVPEQEIPPADLRGELSIPEGTPILVAAGRLSPEKGQDVLVRAIASKELVGAESPHVVLLGDGRSKNELMKLAADLGVRYRVHFAGFRADVLACLAAADLVVNPSYTEGMPNVVLEAMSLGTPVLATAVGGVPELIEDGVTGWLVPPGDPGTLASAIKAALADPELRQTVGGNARVAVASRFTFMKQAESWVKVYVDCLVQSTTSGLI